MSELIDNLKKDFRKSGRIFSLWFEEWLAQRMVAAEAEVTRLRALVEWTPIDEQHLPVVGDEIYALFRYRELMGFTMTAAAVTAVGKDQAHWTAEYYTQNGWTHYRPITPPE